MLSQVGYLPGHGKVATVVLNTLPETPLAFTVRTTDGSARIVQQGVVEAIAPDELSGDLTGLADFSGLETPGTYVVEVGGVVSDPFRVDRTVYEPALRLTMRAYYGQRCGCRVDLGQGYKHPKCHTVGGFSPTSGRGGNLPNTGGWHDAGDYGRYIVNCGITCGTLLWAWELFPDATGKLALEIPESGWELPDYLAEVQWNLGWMLSLQDEADGGVWHKQTSLAFCAFIMPQKDHLPSEVIGTGSAPYKSTCATADFAAVMAIAARCYQPYQPDFAAQCLAAARKAYTWAQANPDVTFQNPPGVTTGGYGDRQCADEILWAAAELYRTTREAAYESDLLAKVTPMLPSLTMGIPSWNSLGSFALWSYALARYNEPNSATDAIRSATAAAAETLIARSRKNGYGLTLAAANYHWGSNSDAGNQSLLLLLATRFAPDRRATEAALANLHYLLGRNCFGVSWVTHLGTRPFEHPHHRPSAADDIAAPWPGLLSGGPNAFGGDVVADALPKRPPMRMWVDDQRAYSLNEVAINWNAPLVFLLAAASSRHLAGPYQGAL